MIRMQVQLTQEQVERLRRLAASQGVSVAAVVRSAIDRLEDENERKRKWARAMAVVGKYHGGGGNVAEEHDRYLDEIYGDWQSS